MRVEKAVALLIPPACREEVLGDLFERYRSPAQYCVEATLTIPLVILSRIRRTADAEVLTIQAFALYASFLGAAWLVDGALLREQWGLVRLAAPAVMALLGLVIEDAYARLGRRTPIRLARGPLVGVGLVVASQAGLAICNAGLGVPGWTVLYGCAMSLILSSAIRLLFPPASDQSSGQRRG